MTDQELNAMMRRVIIDSLKLDLYTEDDEVTFKPSLQYQRQTKCMLKDPLKWAAKKNRPMWKVVARNVAMFLLVISLGFGAVMIGSPTARAAFVQWVAEWYETHIIYKYLGESSPDEMPQYGIAELPTGFEETERTELPRMTSVIYENEVGDIIYFDYAFMAQGGEDIFHIDDSSTFEIMVNHMNGQFFESSVSGDFNTITWIDTKHDIQYNINSTMSFIEILHMAESISLEKTTK